MSQVYKLPTDAKEHVQAANAPDEEALDPLAGGVDSPRYVLGTLPPVYEQFALDQCYRWGGNMEIYAGCFAPSYAAQLHQSVRVRLNFAEASDDTPIVSLGMLISKSGVGKSGVHKEVLKPTRVREAALYAAQLSEAEKAGKEPGKLKHHAIDRITLERLYTQQNINQGEPMIVCPEEVSNLLDGMTGHLPNGYRQFADLMNVGFDCGSSTMLKQNKAESDLMAECVYFNVLACATIARIAKWENLDTAQKDGFFGRFDVVFGTANYNYPRDLSKCDPEARDAWEASQLKLRPLRDVILVPPKGVLARWIAWVTRKKDMANACEDTSEGVAAWLRKAEKRAMRLAALFELMKHVEGGSQCETRTKGKFGQTTLVQISEESMAAAIHFHDTFLYNQQRYFHDHLLLGNEFHSHAVHLFYRLLANKMQMITREDFWGSKCLPMALRSKDEYVRQKFAGYVLGHGWLVPDMTSQLREQRLGEVGRSRFNVIPDFHEKFAHYAEAARSHWTEATEWKTKSDW